MKRMLGVFLSLVFLATGASAVITVTAPASQTNIRSCNEYSTDVLRDKWDMSQRTDLGWRIFNTVEQPPSFLTNISFSGGIFSAKTVSTDGGNYSDCNISILDSHYSGTMATGKVGAAYPIDANKYTVLIMRASFDPATAGSLGIIYWSTNSIYDGFSYSHPVYIYKGWAYYAFDMPAIMQGSDGNSGAWTGTVGSLRIDPIQEKDRTFQIDWIRLVEKDAALEQTITWEGNSGNVDIYLDNNTNPADGTLGILARNQAGTSYSFLAGGLDAGDYYVHVCPTGTSPASAGSDASSGFYRVNDAPILAFSKPTAEGSTEDFATATFNDPWDMANLQDVESTRGIASSMFTALSYHDQAGAFFPNRTVYQATSSPTAAPAGDPHAYLLHWGDNERGRNRKINADRYHNLVATFGIAGGFNFAVGSMARVVWKRAEETAENVSDDIIVRHLNDNSVDWGQTVLNKFVFDLKTLPLETGGGSPSTSGWGGWIDGFRIDPHEFPTARDFYIDDVRLTADWRADTSFPITWGVVHTGGTTTVSVGFDIDASGYDGTIIASGLTGTSTVWNCTAVHEGTYWIYAMYSDGTNTGQCYAGGPVIIEHHATPQIQLSRDHINFGAVADGVVTRSAQVVLANAGTGTLNWSISIPADNPFVKVSPMSGTGNAVLTITIDSATLPPSGLFAGTVTVSDPGAWNSPQKIELWGAVYAAGASGSPFGDFATPLNGTTGVTGAIPVTGWVLDDVETTSVRISRDPVASDPPAAIGPNGLVYIGDSIFVEGARPDVELDYPTFPLNFRAGWGYMLLTNFLPAQGNGSFKLYAIATDAEGHVVTLGTRTITCVNADAVKPFGTIDTPVQGGVSSGTFFSFGWVLTPLPGTVPKDGHTISVYVDSVLLGNLSTAPNVYNQYRADVSNNFPGLNNTGGPGGLGGPVGAFNLNTTGYLNGVHTLFWIAFDDQGQGDGIGSRYFNISNAGGAPIAPEPGAFLPVDPSGRLRIGLAPVREESATEANRFRLKPAPLKRAFRGAGPIELDVEELGFVELRFRAEGRTDGGEGRRFVGWSGDGTRALPVGSTLDPATGVFSWVPGPGFLGRHVLHFALSDGEKKSPPIEVIVEIVPKKPSR